MGVSLTIASYIPTIVFNSWALNRHYIGNHNYGLWIMDYELCVKPSTFPILSNSVNIGKNLKVYKGVSGRVNKVDEWTREQVDELNKWTGGQDACEKG